MNEELKPAQELSEILQVRRDKLAALQAAGSDPFQITKFDVSHHSREVVENYASLEGKTVSVAGRMMVKRVMGKASFCKIQDREGMIQCYVSRDDLGEDYAAFKKLDIGDIVGISGFVFQTKTGEVTVHAEKLTLLSKSLKPLPEKFHGLTDVDVRYRQRYVDLIVNPEVRDTFIKRSQIISEIRRFLDARGFMEVETPMLVSNAGGAAARPFETHYNALDEDVRLRISLELYLKRLIVGGLEKVYEIGRVFRNEGLDTRHNPEFTLMELYQAYTDYNGMMDLTEAMFRHLAEVVCGTTTITYQGTEIDLGKPFERLTMTEAVKRWGGVDFDTVSTLEEARALARERGIEVAERHEKGDILNLFFETALRPVEGRALRALHLRPRDVQRLQRTQRPDRSACALRRAGRAGRRRRRRGQPHRRGLPQRPRDRHASHGRHRLRHRPSGHAADRLALDPRRPALPDHEARE